MSTFCRPVAEINVPGPLRIQPRPRLLARMDELCANPVLWVGGPPGSGKTALVASYLSTRELAGTWCRMGKQNDAGALAIPLAHVLQRVSRPGSLVIEDSHQIPVTVLAELTTEWTACGPAGVQLILIGRGEPPTSLAPLIVKGVIGTLGASELRFSLEELRQWTASLGVDTSALMQWHEKCQGWALGIARMLEGLRRHPEDPTQASEIAKQDLFAYFSAEVFGPATPIERQALVSAALVARTSSQIASGLSGSAEAFEVLVRMAKTHNFATRAAGIVRSYELMPLFREFLLDCIADAFPSAERSLLAIRATALLDKEPEQDWLGGCNLLKAYFALRRGDRTTCHQVLRTALNDADSAPGAFQACAVFPTAVALLCAEALRESIAPESARRLIERHRLPAPALAGRHWPWPFKVYTLDGFRLLQAERPIRLSGRRQRKPLQLLQALLAFGATEVPAYVLLDALWPDSEGDAGYHALESTLYRLRQMLGAADAVRMESRRLSLDRSQFWVDLWEFEHELQSARSGETNIAERVGRIRQLYAGHFLEHESEEPWALKTRQELRDRFIRCMRDAARLYETRNLWQESAKLYQSGLELDPLNEDLYRGLMVCHRELGDHSEALQTYGRCRELLTRFLGIPPNAKTQAIYHSVHERAAMLSAITSAHPPNGGKSLQAT